jgi:hypothetical protein
MHRSLPALLAALLALWPGASRAAGPFSLTLEGFYGPANRDTLKLQTGVASGELGGTHGTFGVAAIVKLSVVELGALWEQGIEIPLAKDNVWAALLGAGFDAPVWLRWEALAEVGGHRVSDIGGAGSGVATWLPYAGLRPGLSARIPAGPVHLVAGAWAFWRWDLKTVATSVGGVSVPTGTYDVGGTSRGLEFRLGLEI